MGEDEQQIRDLVATFWSASQSGDVDTVLSLMTEDVVFLVAGRPPMHKPEFAALSRPPPGTAPSPLQVRGEIKEVSVSGDLAFLWSELEVTVQPPGVAFPVRRAGHTLSVFRRVAGRWLLARDANLLVVRA
jgi:uncharacterized protein (TIGR02246 family)